MRRQTSRVDPSAYSPAFWPHLEAARRGDLGAEGGGYLRAFDVWRRCCSSSECGKAEAECGSVEDARVVVSAPSESYPFCRPFPGRDLCRPLRIPVVTHQWVFRLASATTLAEVSPWAAAVGCTRRPFAGLRVGFTGIGRSSLARWWFLARLHGAEIADPSACDVLVCGSNATPAALAAAQAGGTTPGRTGIRCVRQAWLRASIHAGELVNRDAYLVPEPGTLDCGWNAPSTPSDRGARPVTPPVLQTPVAPQPARRQLRVAQPLAAVRSRQRAVALCVVEEPVTAEGRDALGSIEAIGWRRVSRPARATHLLCTHQCFLSESLRRRIATVGNEWWLAHCVARGVLVRPCSHPLWRPINIAVRWTHARGARASDVLCIAGDAAVSDADVRSQLTAIAADDAVAVVDRPTAPTVRQRVQLCGFNEQARRAALYTLRAAGCVLAPPRSRRRPAALVADTNGGLRVAGKVIDAEADGVPVVPAVELPRLATATGLLVPQPANGPTSPPRKRRRTERTEPATPVHLSTVSTE
eukprot:TRINITY_DN8843_c0_g1_i1.p1 TRINITY_DN8843_c0_g1~~TRINITY_DN8843_c0_g1_i1.p1  ORF type:complete len:528 (+),score=72.53 TRINITY_DN8843_c0_g1_i1:52-1635(+)